MTKRFAARLILVAFLLITVPGITTSFNAQAGHSMLSGHVGEWCQCGCAYCICDPGETPEMCINSAQPAPGTDKPAKGNLDLGSLGLVGLAFITMLRRFVM